MKTTHRIPHVEVVEVPRAHVMRLTFDDGIVRELEFLAGGNEGTVFAPLDDPEFFAQVLVDPRSPAPSVCLWKAGSPAFGSRDMRWIDERSRVGSARAARH